MEPLPDFNTLSSMSDQQLQDLFGVRDLFTYELDFASVLGNNGTAQSSFTVQADSNFLWQYGVFEADLAGAAMLDGTRVLPLISCVIQDAGSGRNLMSSAVPVTSIFGSGEMPFVLPTPRFFRAQTQVNVTLLNFSAATNYALRLSFIGTKFWKYAQ